jgi:hypothetical protein
MYAPATVFALNAGAMATPEVLVGMVTVDKPPAKVPVAPLPLGAVKITDTPLATLPPASFTVACSRVPKGVLMAMLCPEPAVAAICVGGPARLVSEKLAVKVVLLLTVTVTL